MTDNPTPGPDWWRSSMLETLSEADRVRFAHLTEWFRQHGANDPEEWALSEVYENIAQSARLLFLRGVWRNMHDAAERALSSEIAARLVRTSEDGKDLRDLVQYALGSLAFHLVYLLDEPADTSWPTDDGVFMSDVGPDDARWRLMELSPAEELSGRDLGGLHESIFDADPSGTDGDGWTWPQKSGPQVTLPGVAEVAPEPGLVFRPFDDCGSNRTNSRSDADGSWSSDRHLGKVNSPRRRLGKTSRNFR